MKKTIMAIIMFLCLATPVYGLVAGNSETVLHFDNCVSLTVEVSSVLGIDEGEYNFTGCSQVENNTWSCDCYAGYDLVINTDVRTVNNYSVAVTYVTTVTYEETRGGGGGGGGLQEWFCGNWSLCKDGEMLRVCHRPRNVNINYTEVEECEELKPVAPKPFAPKPVAKVFEPLPLEKDDVLEDEKEVSEKSWLGKLFGLLAVLIMIICYLLYWWKFKRGGG